MIRMLMESLTTDVNSGGEQVKTAMYMTLCILHQTVTYTFKIFTYKEDVHYL